jgi:hypothetical protein
LLVVGLAADLVRRRVSVIFEGGGSEPAFAAKAATSQIPIVFATGADPIIISFTYLGELPSSSKSVLML